MKLIITLTFVIISITLLGKSDTNTVDKGNTQIVTQLNKNEAKTVKEIEKIIQLPSDTLNILVENKAEQSSGFEIQKNMPWIGAILIAILTVWVNYKINEQIRETNAKNIESQLANAREINQRDFNKTVLSGNRQMWINDLRDTVSKILSKTVSLSLKQEITHDELQELVYLITKTELMLNPKKDKKFILALKNLHLCFISILKEEMAFPELEEYTTSVKNYTKKTLKIEWERVKKGE